MDISAYFEPDLVAFLDCTSRDDVLKILCERAAGQGKIHDSERFLSTILHRERLVSTGIGMGVAIPHSKLSGCDHFFIVVGILKSGVDWNALDGAPVRLVFLIGGPDDKQTEYLQILSSLTFMIKEEEKRKKILTLNSATDIITLFQQS